MFFVEAAETFEHAHDKTFNKTCTTGENSDQLAHHSSLIAGAFYSLRATQRGTNEKQCHSRWTYKLI